MQALGLPLDSIELLFRGELQAVDEEVPLLEPLMDVASDPFLVDATQGQKRPAGYVVCTISMQKLRKWSFGGASTDTT